MLYTKLPVILLSVIASEKVGTTNHVIASYIIEHSTEIKNCPIHELAKLCHVANSSISRFCKEIGLESYEELKYILNEDAVHFDQVQMPLVNKKEIAAYANEVSTAIVEVADSISTSQIIDLCKDIKKYKKVAIFGLLKGQLAVYSLQTDLLMLNKSVYTTFVFQQQVEYLRQVDKDTLLIIFSYTGTYFDYQNLRSMQMKLEQAKIYFITGYKGELPSFIDERIGFASDLQQKNHPYQLQFVSSLIGQVYANLYT